ncbi:MAG TPA: stage II sporulation protein P [Eubacteriaceae bacterium]|nr:stage II sporulation protein P [Eubacteriaceae bacterium]
MMFSKKKKYVLSSLVLLFLLFFSFINTAKADDWYEEKGYYTIYIKDTSELLFMIAHGISIGDEYLSGDNKLYEIVEVKDSGYIGYAEFKEDIKLPEISSIEEEGLALMLQQQERKIGLFHTHSDESYEPTDGKSSIDGKGGIYKVGDALKKGLEENNINVIHKQDLHLPHDAGAYRRSRPTKEDILKQNPSAIFDVHRDGIPADQYSFKLNGKDATKVRLVVGKKNQNIEKNKNLAFKLKAVSDEMYPGLLKDIFMGKGNYNQDLAPNTILLEIGTHKNSREAAQNTAKTFADVIKVAVFGGGEKIEGQKDEPAKTVKNTKPAATDNRGTGRGIFMVLGIAAVLTIGFLFISTGGKELRSKFGETFSSFIGRKRK